MSSAPTSTAAGEADSATWKTAAQEAWNSPSLAAAARAYHEDRKRQPPPKVAPKPLLDREYVLAELRVARVRAQLFIVEIDSIALALKNGVIDVEDALAWLREEA
jgi:hypothetical protein